eukprot:SAG22_NODE_155_length_17123_cov_37.528489_6_plen_65_part_00
MRKRLALAESSEESEQKVKSLEAALEATDRSWCVRRKVQNARTGGGGGEARTLRCSIPCRTVVP